VALAAARDLQVVSKVGSRFVIVFLLVSGSLEENLDHDSERKHAKE